MLERYDGHQALALAAYNAGPGKVDEWLKNHGDPRRGDIDAASWIQKIPFQETRDYTRNILKDLQAANSQPREPQAAVQASGWSQAAQASRATAERLSRGQLLAVVEGKRIGEPQSASAALNEAPLAVALDRQQPVVARHLSVAFAQPIRIDSKEALS
jgi:soluble lytic murein transglycosylase